MPTFVTGHLVVYREGERESPHPRATAPQLPAAEYRWHGISSLSALGGPSAAGWHPRPVRRCPSLTRRDFFVSEATLPYFLGFIGGAIRQNIGWCA